MTRTLEISLVTLGDPETMTGGYLYHRRMAGAAPRHGARIQFVSLPEAGFPLPALSAGRVLAEAVRKCNVLLLDSIATAYVGPWLAAKAPSVPVAAILHQPPGGIDHGTARTWVQACLDRLAYRSAALLLAASQSLVDELLFAGLERARLRLVPPGRDPAPRVERAGLDLRAGRKAALLCVANWLPRKGLHHLLEAFSALPPRAATLHLVGDHGADARYTSAIRSLLARRALHDRVVVHDAVSAERLSAMYGSADLFVLPSLKEPYGTVWAEAMAAGLPVVGFRAGNLPYLADNWREAVMVTPGDVDGLASALAALVEDEALRRRLGGAARRRAHRFPTWDETAALFFRSLREI